MNAPLNHKALAVESDPDESPCECCGKAGVRWAGAYENTFSCEPCAQDLDLAEAAYSQRAMRYSR
jgi:hypothetical protein